MLMLCLEIRKQECLSPIYFFPFKIKQVFHHEQLYFWGDFQVVIFVLRNQAYVAHVLLFLDRTVIQIHQD